MVLEKEEMGYEEREARMDQEKVVTQIKVIKGDEAFNEAYIKNPPKAFSSSAIVLYLACLVGFMCSTMNGYDGSLLNGLLANPDFKDFFNGSNAGIWAGIVSSMYQIGSVVAIPAIGPAVDNYGRRVGMFIGAFTIVIGTIIQGTTFRNASVGQFMGGRFLLGFGVSIAASAGPVYVVEVSHPAYRGVVTALYNCFWFTGSIVAGGATRGSLNLGGHTSWLIPVWLQLMASCIIVGLVWLLPESPRWLYVNNKQESAKAMLIKYHGEGSESNAWVQLQLSEYEQYLEMDGADKRWWDYRALFRNRASIYRLACNCVISIYGQWAGNAVLSYFLSAVLDTAGVTDPVTQLNINLGLSCLQFASALVGASLVDRVGRRPLLLFTNAGCCLVWIGVTAATATYDSTQSATSARATIAFIFIFGVVYAVGFTPLQALYPVEVLSFEMRAKGMAFSNLAVSAGGLLNQFAWPVSLEKIGWKTYICFVIWCAFQTVTIYFFIPETKNRTLEELDDIFSAKNPKKASLEKKKIALDANANVVNVEVAV
ncbi:hypothetical protein MMC24_005918 [Lignoscripta atroalba]|nr:hypothetical protein [Lignoscripta atroalba]